MKSKAKQNQVPQPDQNSDFKCKLPSKIRRPDIQIAGTDCNQATYYRGDSTEHTSKWQQQWNLTPLKTLMSIN